MRLQKSTRHSLVLALLATCLLTIDTTSVSNKPDEDVTTTPATTITSTTTTTDSSQVFDEEDGARQDAFNSENTKTKEKENKFCSGTIKRGVVWPDAKAGTKLSALCPEGSNGRQFWECSPEGRWVTENPDTAFCESYWIDEWVTQLILALKNDNDLKVKPRYPMVQGDWHLLLSFLEDVQAFAKDCRNYNQKKLLNLVVSEVSQQIFQETEIWESWNVVKEYVPRLLAVMGKAMASAEETQATRDMGKTTACSKGTQSTRDTGKTMASAKRTKPFWHLKRETIRLLIGLPCGTLLACIISLIICNVVESCCVMLYKKLSQLVSDWRSQLAIRQHKKLTPPSTGEQSIGAFEESRENDEEHADWDTFDIPPVLDKHSNMELEKEMVDR